MLLCENALYFITDAMWKYVDDRSFTSLSAFAARVGLGVDRDFRDGAEA